MLWALLLACGTDTAGDATPKTPAVEPVTDDTPDTPTADQILTAHNEATNQCELLKADNYKLEWKAQTTDGHSKQNDKVEVIVHQGRPNKTYTRIHQVRSPAVRFAAFGRDSSGKYWSASDVGVHRNLPDDMAAPLAAGMNPTSICEFERKWPERKLIGAEPYEGEPAWHVEVAWVNGSTIDFWFHREHHVLMASKTATEESKVTVKLADYTDFSGIRWPKTEVAKRQEGPLQIQTTQTLVGLDLDNAKFPDIGPQTIASAMGTKE